MVVLAIGGTSDWVDGYLARRLDQVSRLGELLDPLADRLYILATLIALHRPRRGALAVHRRAARPRGRCCGVCLLVLRRHGYGPPPVHYVGKTATFILLAAFPVLLLAAAVPAAATVAMADRLGPRLVGPGAVLGGRRSSTWCRRPGWYGGRGACGSRGEPAVDPGSPGDRKAPGEQAGTALRPGLPHRAVPEPAGSRLRRRRGPPRPVAARPAPGAGESAHPAALVTLVATGFLLAIAYRKTVARGARPQPGPRRTGRA